MNESTLYTLTYLLSQALGVYAVYKLIRSFFDGSRVKRITEMISYVGYYFLTSSIYLIINIPLVNLCVNVLAFFLLTLIYSAPIKQKILAALMSYIILVCTELITVTLTGYINFPLIERNTYNSVFGIVAVNVSIFAISLAASGFKNIKIGNALPWTYWISLVLIPLASLFMLTITFQSEGLTMFQIAVSVAVVLVINFTVFFLFDRLARLYQEKQEKGIIEQQNKYYENQLQIINATQEVSSILRHDMKNHLSAVLLDIKNGDINEAEKYISDIVGVYRYGTEIVSTGYPAIDSIVNFKLQTAKKNGIRVSVNASLPPNLNFSSFDSTVIFGNLIDNALEAVTLLGEKGFIDLAIHYSKGMLIIKISNPFKTIIKKNGEFITSKADKNNHGYGLRSVRETVEKYNGTIEIETGGNIFTVTAILYVE